jgi:hypothetical protein
MIMHISDAFSQHIHALLFNSFFHRASLPHRFEASLTKPGPLLALIGTTCDMLDIASSTKETARGCLSKAETMAMEHISSASIVVALLPAPRKEAVSGHPRFIP